MIDVDIIKVFIL